MGRKITGWPVMRVKCPSCPFRDGGDIQIRNNVLRRTNLQASQICHHPVVHGKRETHLCRGARDEQLTILFRLGFIPAPTDEAFIETSNRVLAEGRMPTAVLEKKDADLDEEDEIDEEEDGAEECDECGETLCPNCGCCHNDECSDYEEPEDDCEQDSEGEDEE